MRKAPCLAPAASGRGYKPKVTGAKEQTPLWNQKAGPTSPYESLKSIITGAARKPRVFTATYATPMTNQMNPTVLAT